MVSKTSLRPCPQLSRQLPSLTIYLLIVFILCCSGGKITKVSGDCIKIIDSNGHNTVVEDETCEDSLSASTRLLWDHFQQVTFIPFVHQGSYPLYS
jgi:hypothetical protein